eukprot:scaffold3823_cov195-Amphora_coffeaeformis.AAC.39
MKRSLKRGTISPAESVRYLECTSILMAYNCLSDLTVRNKNTTNPPPDTVSIVRAKRLGVSASKSCNTSIP